MSAELEINRVTKTALKTLFDALVDPTFTTSEETSRFFERIRISLNFLLTPLARLHCCSRHHLYQWDLRRERLLHSLWKTYLLGRFLAFKARRHCCVSYFAFNDSRCFFNYPVVMLKPQIGNLRWVAVTVGCLSLVGLEKILPLVSHFWAFGRGKWGVFQGEINTRSGFFGAETVALYHSDVWVGSRWFRSAFRFLLEVNLVGVMWTLVNLVMIDSVVNFYSFTKIEHWGLNSLEIFRELRLFYCQRYKWLHLPSSIKLKSTLPLLFHLRPPAPSGLSFLSP